MTVKELIEKLKDFDQDLEVLVDTNSFFYDIDDVQTVEKISFDKKENEEKKAEEVIIS